MKEIDFHVDLLNKIRSMEHGRIVLMRMKGFKIEEIVQTLKVPKKIISKTLLEFKNWLSEYNS